MSLVTLNIVFNHLRHFICRDQLEGTLFVHLQFDNAVHYLDVFVVVIKSKQLVCASRNTRVWLKTLLVVACVCGVEAIEASYKSILFVELEEILRVGQFVNEVVIKFF